ncbi:MAG: hypothetical protein CMP91_13225 [Gammaproteobacteria bacterium]|nr:hypothetical protein [Gammaproteobacteria bacterium]MAY02488.1 hypothetical protein [Gammaproteobacteria bacterium]|tara:strand:- start:58260 stop:58445 length:186 start_codon:yes stop_codon:yes gene_type:complete
MDFQPWKKQRRSDLSLLMVVITAVRNAIDTIKYNWAILTIIILKPKYINHILKFLILFISR